MVLKNRIQWDLKSGYCFRPEDLYSTVDSMIDGDMRATMEIKVVKGAEGEIVDDYDITLVMMTEEEYEKMPEFRGF